MGFHFPCFGDPERYLLKKGVLKDAAGVVQELQRWEDGFEQISHASGFRRLHQVYFPPWFDIIDLFVQKSPKGLFSYIKSIRRHCLEGVAMVFPGCFSWQRIQQKVASARNERIILFDAVAPVDPKGGVNGDAKAAIWVKRDQWSFECETPKKREVFQKNM